MRYHLFLLAGVLFTSIAYSQRVNNVRASMDGANVKITYDLEGSSESDQFEIKLYSSLNNFSDPLKLVTGMVGKSIKPGKDLVISWKAREELVNYQGELTFEVRATLLGGYYTVTNPSSSSKFKKGKLMPINWQGGESGEKVKIELIGLTGTVATISENVGNQGSYIWTIPKSTKPSKSYKVKISNTSDVNSQGTSKSFAVTGGSAAPFIIIPLALGAGAGAYILLQPGPTKPPPDDGGGSGLPKPPSPTE